MNRAPPPVVPPPAPLGPLPVPAPPPAPPVLAPAEKIRHLAGAGGAFVAGGLLGYGVLRAFLAGWLEPCAATLGWGLAGACWVGAGLLLLPFLAEWHSVQASRAAQAAALVHTQRVYARALHDQRLWAATYLRDRTPPPDPPARVRVMGVERPAPGEAAPATGAADEDSEDSADDLPTPTSIVTRARDLVAAWLHPTDPAPAPPAPTERPTQRLPVLAWFRPAVPVLYTDDMRLVVAVAYQGPGTVADLLKTKRLPRGRWDAACRALSTAGVLVKGRGGAWVLAPRLRTYVTADYDLSALHIRVQRAVQASMQARM